MFCASHIATDEGMPLARSPLRISSFARLHTTRRKPGATERVPISVSPCNDSPLLRRFVSDQVETRWFKNGIRVTPSSSIPTAARDK
ncbi:hypothetical protein KCP69_13155 [Salmonella enterica subsp. enterica]|nr:hypothetical protein KCP69_13155 [Salmonella enterica subsp. enterica]